MVARENKLIPFCIFNLTNSAGGVSMTKDNSMRKDPLENSIAGKITGSSSGKLTEAVLSRYQVEMLRRTIEYVVDRSTFYRQNSTAFPPKTSMCRGFGCATLHLARGF